MVNPRNHYLLTSTDIEGECVIKTYKLHPSDSLQFQGMGYQTVKYSVNDLLRMKHLVLVPLAYELEETNVEKGISMKELLKRASSKLKKQAPGLEPICKYFGKALYEKKTRLNPHS